MAFVKVKECLTNPRQLIKLILLVICVCISIYQMSESINKMLHPPITSYYKFKYNETIKYPALTICRKPGFKKHLFPRFGLTPPSTREANLLVLDLFKNFSFANHTLSDFINVVTYNRQETIPMWAFKDEGFSSDVEFRTSVFTERGLCHTIIPKKTLDPYSVTNGYWLYLKHSSSDKSKDDTGLSTSGFEIHIHNENDVKDEKTMTNNFLYLESAEAMFVTLTVQAYSQISTKEQPCRNEGKYSKSQCEEECWHNGIADTVGCTVPWLKHLKGNYSECGSYLDINKINELLSDVRRLEFLSTCDCPIPCNNSIYSYQIESRRDADAITAPSSTLNMYFASNLITELTEVISYDWNIFLSDVGGSLGFLLGLSVIGTVSVIEEILNMLVKKPPQPEKEKTPEVQTEGESLKSVMEFMANCDMYQHKMAAAN